MDIFFWYPGGFKKMHSNENQTKLAHRVINTYMNLAMQGKLI